MKFQSEMLTATQKQKEMLDHFAELNKRTRAERKTAAQPQVGIFFFYNNHLLSDTTPLSEAQDYGDFRGHRVGHDTFWGQLQRNEFVPRDVEYDEVPRGRVGYDKKERKFYIFLDKCIRNNPRVTDKIERDFSLPASNTVPPKLDSHYVCPGCKKKSKKQLQQEEEDWDF